VSCNDGFYKNFTNLTCLACDITCKTCTTAGPNACLSCNDGRFLLGSVCS